MRAVLACALLLLVAACGGNDEPDPELNAQLLEAARANRVDEARSLIERGADVNAKDETEQSAYLYATSEVGPDPALLELTLANGADVDAKDSYNGTGLIRAAHRGYAEIVQRLIDAEIELDHVNRLGWTALLEAVILGDGGAASRRDRAGCWSTEASTSRSPTGRDDRARARGARRLRRDRGDPRRGRRRRLIDRPPQRLEQLRAP